MKTVTAITDFGPLGGAGQSAPHRMLCDDDQEYVVKFPIDGWPRALVNEGLGGRLAQELQLPIPDFALIEISDDLIGASPMLHQRGIGAGTYFGTVRLRHAFNFFDARAGVITAEHVTNRDQIAGAFGFDNWLINGDRQNLGNALLQAEVKDGGPVFRFYLIDCGFILAGPEWTPQSLDRWKDYSDFIRGLPLMHACVFEPDEFEPFIEKMQAISEQDLHSILLEIPIDWPLNEEDAAKVVELLAARKAVVAELLRDRMLLGRHFPNIGWFSA